MTKQEINDSLSIAPTKEELNKIFQECANMVGVNWDEVKNKNEKNKWEILFG